uniref:CTNNB1 binding N-teminal domain-containing protein n=1 Tax=Trichuris muris TaxID=70415 RepID=A0A5S6QM22_TRIMR
MSRSGRSTSALTEATTSSVQDVSESQVDFGVDHGGIIQSSGANAPDEFGAKTHLNTQPDVYCTLTCFFRSYLYNNYFHFRFVLCVCFASSYVPFP